MESEEHPMMKGAMEELAALNCTARFIRFIISYTTNCHHVIQYDRDGFFFENKVSSLFLE